MTTIYTADEDRVISEVKRMLLEEFRQMLENQGLQTLIPATGVVRDQKPGSDLIRFSLSTSTPESPVGLNFTSSTNGHAVTPAGPAKETEAIKETVSSISKVLNTETFPLTLDAEPVVEIKFTPLDPGQWLKHLKSIRPIIMPGDIFEGWMAHFVSVNEFYIHNEPETNASVSFAMQEMANQMKKLKFTLPDNQFSSNCLVAAKWTDYAWYRAWITGITGKDEAEVFFIDYGNTARVKRCDLLPLADDVRGYTVQAVKCRLHEYDESDKHHKYIPQVLEHIMRQSMKLVFDVRAKREPRLFEMFQNHDVKITFTDGDEDEEDALRFCLKQSIVACESESGLAEY